MGLPLFHEFDTKELWGRDNALLGAIKGLTSAKNISSMFFSASV